MPSPEANPPLRSNGPSRVLESSEPQFSSNPPLPWSCESLALGARNKTVRLGRKTISRSRIGREGAS
jgi:hypothetical protein